MLFPFVPLNFRKKFQFIPTLCSPKNRRMPLDGPSLPCKSSLSRSGPLFKRGQGALKRKYKAGYVEEWRGGERGRGTRSNESRTERTSWVKGQTFRSCPLAPWVQRALYRVLRDFFPSFSLSFPRESNVGTIQVDKQALTCISYEVVEDRDSFSRIRTRYNYHVNRPSDTFVFTRYSSGQE